MAKDPAVLFYTSDFISGTLTMTDEQRGRYILLLCLQHQKGYLTEKDMLNICKTYDEDIWVKFKEIEGKYYNERMRIESERRRKYSESRSKNRTIISKTYDKHMETETETINKDINIVLNVPFETFWNLYDKKQDKIKCERKWKNLTNKERKECIEKLPAYISSTPDKQYRKNPATYLNNKSWENEIIMPINKNLTLSYDEMLKLAHEKGPEVWKKYKAIKRDNNNKVVFEPIE